MTRPPSIFLALNFCCSNDCQKLWNNCSLFVNISFVTADVLTFAKNLLDTDFTMDSN